ncbi:MAG: DUF1254 domain-containing protein [Pseudomonadota bacterium]
MSLKLIRVLGATLFATGVLCSATTVQAAPVTEQEAYEIGIEAYVYAYPLVTMDTMRRQVTNVTAAEQVRGRAPVNAWAHIRTYPPGEYRDIVRPNFDTLYSFVWLDVTKEPVIVSTPDNLGRYYLLPLMDMWTDIFASPGSRTSGDGARSFAVVAPGWRGKLPAGVERIEAPTSVIMLVGRTQTNGEADYAAVQSFQDGMRLTPLSLWGKPQLAPAAAALDPAVDNQTPPMQQVNAMPAAAFFAQAAALMSRHAPHLTDQAILARLKPIGLEPGKPFDLAKAAPAVQRGLQRAAPDALKLMAGKIARLAPRINGWMMSPENIGVYGNSYLTRAAVALTGLAANTPEDSMYGISYADIDGKPLNGNTAYTLRFNKDELPPVRAFWSVTVYDNEAFPVPNPLKRYALGDRDKMQHGADGSLTLYIRSTSPGAALESNWLPVPAGPFNLTLRAYYPRATMLQGVWHPPGVRKAD